LNVRRESGDSHRSSSDEGGYLMLIHQVNDTFKLV